MFGRGLKSLSLLSPHLERLGGTKPSFAPYKPIRFEDQARVLIDAKVPAFSFIYGVPPKEILDECRRLGILLIGAATLLLTSDALVAAMPAKDEKKSGGGGMDDMY